MRRLAPDLILRNRAAGRTAGRLQAAALFVDVTGFSAVTDALLQYGQYGAELLAGVMRDTFQPLGDFAGALAAKLPSHQLKGRRRTPISRILGHARIVAAAFKRRPQGACIRRRF